MSNRTHQVLLQIRPLIIGLLICLVATGIVVTNTAHTSYWKAGSCLALALWLLVSSIGFAALRYFFKDYAHSLSLIAVSLLLLIGTGYKQAIVSTLFFAAAYILGNLLFTRLCKPTQNINSWSLSLITGISTYFLILSIIIPFPINYPALYWGMVILPFAILMRCTPDRQRLIKHLKHEAQQLNNVLIQLPYWHWCTTLSLAGFVGSFAFIPTIMSDDIRYHLGMWSQLTYHHQFLFDVTTQIWSAAPFSGDMLHGFLSVMANDDARGARNIIFYGLLLIVVARISAFIFEDQKAVLLSLMLFSSTSMTANLLIGLQTELFLALLTTAGVYFLLEASFSFGQRTLLVFLTCCLLVSMKLPAVLIAAALTIGLLIKHAKELPSLKNTNLTLTAFFAIVGIFIALTCYIYAYIKTGNPFFPLYNGVFKSPFYAPENHVDLRYVQGASLHSYWGFFFETPKYFESTGIGAGFQYLFAPFVGGLYLFFHRKTTAILIALPIIIFGITFFTLMQYWRYFYPILPLASILAACVLLPLPNEPIKKPPQYLSNLSIIFLVILNLFYFTSICWIFYDNHLQLIIPSARDHFAKDNIPEYELNNYMNKTHPGESVLFAITRPYGASLWGKPIYAARSSPITLQKFNTMRNAVDLENFLQEQNTHYIYWDDEAVTDKFYFRNYVGEFIKEHGTLEVSSKNISLYRIDH